MRKLSGTLIAVLLSASILSISVYAEDSSTYVIAEINELIEKAEEHDGLEITIMGEAIGERLDRGVYSWININDGTNAIGIWMKRSDAETISYYGNYGIKGDIIKIKGVFYRACEEHGGEADLHNISLEITEKGKVLKESMSHEKIIWAALLSAASLLLIILYGLRIKRRVKN